MAKIPCEYSGGGTLSGTTLATLVNAVNDLTQKQYDNSYVIVNGTSYITRKTVLRPKWKDYRVYSIMTFEQPTSSEFYISEILADCRSTGSFLKNKNKLGQSNYSGENDTLSFWELHWTD